MVFEPRAGGRADRRDNDAVAAGGGGAHRDEREANWLRCFWGPRTARSPTSRDLARCAYGSRVGDSSDLLVCSCCVLTRLDARRPGYGPILVLFSHDHPGRHRGEALRLTRCGRAPDRVAWICERGMRWVASEDSPVLLVAVTTAVRWDAVRLVDGEVLVQKRVSGFARPLPLCVRGRRRPRSKVQGAPYEGTYWAQSALPPFGAPRHVTIERSPRRTNPRNPLL